MRTDLLTTDDDFQAKLEAFQAELQYQFKEPRHLELALTHSTFASEARLAASNERLEFLGDSVLNISITKRLFSVFPEEDEGQLSRRRQAIISNRNLAAVAKSLVSSVCSVWVLASKIPKAIPLIQLPPIQLRPCLERSISTAGWRR